MDLENQGGAGQGEGGRREKFENHDGENNEKGEQGIEKRSEAIKF